MQEVTGSIPVFSTKKALYFAGSTVLFFLLKPILGMHCFACMPFWLLRKTEMFPQISGSSQQKRPPYSKLLYRGLFFFFQFRGMAIRRSAFFTSHAPAHPQAAPKMAPPRISVG